MAFLGAVEHCSESSWKAQPSPSQQSPPLNPTQITLSDVCLHSFDETKKDGGEGRLWDPGLRALHCYASIYTLTLLGDPLLWPLLGPGPG